MGNCMSFAYLRPSDITCIVLEVVYLNITGLGTTTINIWRQFEAFGMMKQLVKNMGHSRLLPWFKNVNTGSCYYLKHSFLN